MILAIILLILIILLLSIIILFSFYIFLPSLNTDKLEKDVILSNREKDFYHKEKEDPKLSANKAVVLCSCGKSFTNDISIFNEAYTCFMVKSLSGSGSDCKFACIGLGDCAKVCPQNAIIVKNNTAIITSACCGCRKCAEVYPQQIIKLIPKTSEKIVMCANNDINSFTTCSCKQKEEKVEWIDKKDFKIWTYCYKILKNIKKIIK